MPDKMPTTEDLSRFLCGAGISDSYLDCLPLEAELGAAIEELGTVMGYRPFFTTDTDVTYTFDPAKIKVPSFGYSYLDLGSDDGPGGMTSVSEVRVNVVTGSPGTLLTVDLDYILTPSNAVTQKRPFTTIEFVRGISSPGIQLFRVNQKSITVTGRPGWPEVSFRIFEALLMRAGSRLQGTLSNKLSNGVISWREGDVQRAYTTATTAHGYTGAFAATAEVWASEWDKTIGSKRRVEIF